MTSNGIDFESIARELLPQSLELLRQWFPAGVLSGKEYHVGSLAGEAGESLSVNIETGKWSDFATNEAGGDLISLYAAQHKISQAKAAKALSNGHEIAPQDEYISGQQITVIPRHPKNGTHTAIFEYKNLDGITYGYVCRFQPLNAKKEFAPLTAWRLPNGKIIWKWKKWPVNTQPYHAELIKQKPEAKILIVEGEGKADRAQKLLPEWIVLGWPNGAQAANKADWSSLKFRYCWFWRDNDEPGIQAEKQLKKILPDLHIAQLPEGLPEGWDLGDATDDFNIETYLKPKPKSQSATINDRPAELSSQRAALIFPHMHNGAPLGTIANMRILLAEYGVTCRYNVITKHVELNIPGESFTPENAEASALACIFSRMKEIRMKTEGYAEYICRIADENQFNPVLDWMQSKPWDKRFDQIGYLCDTITTYEPSADGKQTPEELRIERAKNLFIRRWILTAAALISQLNVDGAGCIVLLGDQGLGKTWWVRKLLPEKLRQYIKTGTRIDPHDRDSLSQFVRYFICEFGEIGATFRGADLDALKAFITENKDIFRRPYAKNDQEYPRRTAIIASVNDHIYLNDDENRRFWTIPALYVNSYHEIDMQQVWAQALHLLANGESWIMTQEENALVREINEEHMRIEPLEETILEKYDWENFYSGKWKTATHIANELNVKADVRTTRIITSFVLKINGKRKRKSGSMRLLLVPDFKKTD